MSEQATRRFTRRSIDFTVGTPWKTILLFTIPLFFENMFNQLYNIIDTMIIGRGVSHVALAAIGTGAPLLRVIMALFMGITTGSSVLVSQSFGANNEELLRRTIYTSLVLAVCIGTVLSAIGFTIAPAILRLMKTPDDVFPMAVTYLRVLFFGLFWQLLYSMLSGFMRGIGDSRSPLIILIIASFTNVLFTWLFVYPLQMGIAGSAYGTIISQTLSVVLVIIFFNRTNPMTRIKLKELKLNIVTAKEILTLGMPTSIQQASVSIGSMVVMGYINSYGTAAIAGFATGDRVDILVYATIMSLSLAMTSYTGQNVGAGSMERVNLGVKQGLTLSLIFGAFFSSILLIFSRQFLSLFTTDAQTIAEAMKYLIIIVPSYLFMAISQPLSGIMRGSGETVIPMISSLITVLIVRLPLVFLFNHLLGKIEGVYYAQFAAQVTGCVYLFIAYRRGKWRRRALIKIDSLYNAESTDSTE